MAELCRLLQPSILHTMYVDDVLPSVAQTPDFFHAYHGK